MDLFFKKPDENDPEFKKMLGDIEKYGNEQKGEYKTVKWTARRPKGSYWCGYVHTDIKLTEEEESILDGFTHGGITSEYPIGFDCSHTGDYAPWKMPNIDNPGGADEWYIDNFLTSLSQQSPEFRTFPYVKQKIYDMIDYILTLQ